MAPRYCLVCVKYSVTESGQVSGGDGWVKADDAGVKGAGVKVDRGSRDAGDPRSVRDPGTHCTPVGVPLLHGQRIDSAKCGQFTGKAAREGTVCIIQDLT